MPELESAINVYRNLGAVLVILLGCSALFLACAVGWQTVARTSTPARTTSTVILWAIWGQLALATLLIIWFHAEIHRLITLSLPQEFIPAVNRWIEAINGRSSFPVPSYDPASPPRYLLPFWLEDEKYVFWFFAYCTMAVIARRRLQQPVFEAVILALLAVQVGTLAAVVHPFAQPLPQFFREIDPWLSPAVGMERLVLFMRLYPKLIFYYNAEYMRFHPPLLFLSYSALTVFFSACVAMLWTGDRSCEKTAYDFARPAYLFLTLGMLLGYPWALKAWGPNWWWDPKIACSIMMWVVFSTYLHARLYLSRRGMWHFAGALGIISFAAMLFTFLASFFFPGQHTVH